ncbi:hypothetical protein AB4037_05865 [Labrys sp. KB_33_2]
MIKQKRGFGRRSGCAGQPMTIAPGDLRFIPSKLVETTADDLPYGTARHA